MVRAFSTNHGAMGRGMYSTIDILYFVLRHAHPYFLSTSKTYALVYPVLYILSRVKAHTAWNSSPHCQEFMLKTEIHRYVCLYERF